MFGILTGPITELATAFDGRGPEDVLLDLVQHLSVVGL